MADEVVKVTPEVTPPATPPAQPTAEEKRFTQADLDRMIAERLEREKRKRDEDAAKAKAQAEADAAIKNAEWQKLAELREKELAEARSLLAQNKLADEKRKAATKVGLPDAFASRLIGDTPEALEADAKALLETLPKAPKPSPGGITNPAGAETVGETDAEKRKRLFGY